MPLHLHRLYKHLKMRTFCWLEVSGYDYVLTQCKQNRKLVANKFKSGGLHEKHVVATWNLGNRLSICL